MSGEVVKSKLLTVKQASVKLNIPEKTLRNWIYKGLIPSVRLNGLRRFHEDTLDRWVQEKQRV